MKIEMLFKRIHGNKYIKNTSWMLIERIYQMLLSLAVGLLTARFLGPSNYGIINYVASFVSFATPICGLGLEGILVKKYVNEPQRAQEYIGTSILMEFIVSCLSASVIVIIVGAFNVDDRVKIVVAFLESLSLLFKSTEPIEFWYQANLQSKYTSIVKIIAYTCMNGYRVLLLLTRKSVEWFAFSTSLDMLIIAILYICIFRKQTEMFFRVKLTLIGSLLKESYHFILSGLMVVIYSQMDKIMIQQFLGEREVGLYSASYTICSLWIFVPTALINSARPLILSEKKECESKYLRKLKQLYSGVFWLSALISVFISIFSKLIMYILYGIEYMDASQTLAIGVWYGTFAVLGSARGIWILAEDKNKYVKYYLIWGAIVNMGLNYVWIPQYGINGAAYATLVTQFFTCLIAPLFYKETRVHTKLVLEAILLKW